MIVSKFGVISVTVQLNHILDRERPLPDWMTFGKTVLCQKDLAKGSAVDNYTPISCLPLMWKLMTGMLERENVISPEQKRESWNKRPTAH